MCSYEIFYLNFLIHFQIYSISNMKVQEDVHRHIFDDYIFLLNKNIAGCSCIHLHVCISVLLEKNIYY